MAKLTQTLYNKLTAAFEAGEVNNPADVEELLGVDSSTALRYIARVQKHDPQLMGPAEEDAPEEPTLDPGNVEAERIDEPQETPDKPKEGIQDIPTKPKNPEKKNPKKKAATKSQPEVTKALFFRAKNPDGSVNDTPIEVVKETSKAIIYTEVKKKTEVNVIINGELTTVVIEELENQPSSAVFKSKATVGQVLQLARLTRLTNQIS